MMLLVGLKPGQPAGSGGGGGRGGAWDDCCWALWRDAPGCISSVSEDALEGGRFLLSQVPGGVLLSAVPPAAKDVGNVPGALFSAVPLISRMLEDRLLVPGGPHTSLWSLLLCGHPAWVCGHEHLFGDPFGFP